MLEASLEHNIMYVILSKVSTVYQLQLMVGSICATWQGKEGYIPAFFLGLMNLL